MPTKGNKNAGEEALKKRARDWRAWRDSAVTLWVAADTLWQASKPPEPPPDPSPGSLKEAFAAISTTTADLGLREPSSRVEANGLDRSSPFGNLRIPALMLYGMAIENFLKALMVKSDPEFLQRPPGNTPAWRSHNLKSMAAAASKGRFSVPTFDPKLLVKFSAAITWYGRYPGPLDKHLEASVDPSGAAVVAPRFTSTLDDRILVVGFLEKLKKLVGME